MYRVLGLALLVFPISGSATVAQDCSALASNFATRNVHIVNASYVPVSKLNATFPNATVNLSTSFCRVYGKVDVLNQSTVNFEAWLPDAQFYNGRYLAVGNGGLAGVIDESSMLLGVSQGFATAGGDGGHLQSLNGNGNPTPGSYLPYMHNQVQTREWIRDSIAAFTVPARSIQTRYYGKAPSYSYYTGCSTGGAQAFALAQRHPDLFDGIYASCPGNWYTHLVLMFLWNYVHTQGSAYMDQQTLNFIQNAVLNKCDALDGVKDDILGDPFSCTFNITSLACSKDQSPRVNNKTQCLTKAQVSAAQAFYQGPKDSRNGDSIYPGFLHGSESSWLMMETSLANIYSAAVLQNLVFNSSYNISRFNWGSDVDQVDLKAGTLIDHVSTDMHSFFDRGGKLLVTQGLSDPLNPPTWPIEYLSKIANVTTNISDFMRLFMIPGGGHCGPSPGVPQAPNTVSYMQPLMNWVEKGQAPAELKASNPEDGSNRTRKLCAWPQTAHFDGSSSDDWEDYTCK